MTSGSQCAARLARSPHRQNPGVPPHFPVRLGGCQESPLPFLLFFLPLPLSLPAPTFILLLLPPPLSCSTTTNPARTLSPTRLHSITRLSNRLFIHFLRTHGKPAELGLAPSGWRPGLPCSLTPAAPGALPSDRVPPHTRHTHTLGGLGVSLRLHRGSGAASLFSLARASSDSCSVPIWGGGGEIGVLGRLGDTTWGPVGAPAWTRAQGKT